MPFTVAIMQPYFLPYAGYFRLLAQSDLFVIYDCVQFPRRGWVHRNKLTDRNGDVRWLTLPLRPAPQDVLIRDLEFPSSAEAEMAERLRPFALDGPNVDGMGGVLDRMRRLEGRPADYIVDLLAAVTGVLDLPWRTIRSSSLHIPDHVRGQDRIIEIARRTGADRYLNAPGGRDLYEPDAFAQAGMELAFLPPYAGTGGSILQRLLHDDPATLRGAVAGMVNNSEIKLRDLQAGSSREPS